MGGGGLSWSNDLTRIAQQFFGRNVLGKFGAQKSFMGSVLEQAANKIRHPWQQLADRSVFTNAITHFDQRALNRASHALEELELATASNDTERFRGRRRMCDAADIVSTELCGH